MTLSTLFRTLRSSSADPDHVIMVELAGRGLAEFWTVFFLSSRPFSRRIWVTVHDTPAVCGGAFFFTALDRRGGRRIANWFSRWLGRKAERTALQRVERIYCLSTMGAHLLAEQLCLRRPVLRLPFVATATTGSLSTRRIILLPGYLDGVQNVAPVLSTLAVSPACWHLEIGSCSANTKVDIRSLARQMDVDHRVEWLDYLNETELDAAFERAAIVVRWRDCAWLNSDGAPQGAVSGALMNALAHGCAVITNDSRGFVECMGEAQAMRVQTERELQAGLSNLIQDDTLRERMGTAGRTHISTHHSVAVVCRELTQD